ncbi:SusC/RagA family TonB-linked outer membrane protein [Flavisolibacter nicotianae]|uniref:SusC/RagA family TonB-linked outer membrane protein n=1 Tax=Flavisolibacter nicotianae TaxID=2364882 RepID=UPI000EADC39E|nr:TonB-dependent receptor [Flavisolibacter nicotianae]
MKIRLSMLTMLAFLLYCSGLHAQTLQIKGNVQDEKGPLAGASVLVKGLQTGTSTDAKGNFSVAASLGSTLVVSSTGYLSQEVVVNAATPLSITLVSDPKSMEGVVVIGYGTKKKQFLTGAVSTVGSEVFQSRPVTNALAALQGEVAGTTIQRYSGQPGSEDFNLNVRGPSSKNGAASPLVLIDGIEGNLYLLNPSDIESISVLKDAQASIYGARAAGGVMLVTTKKGKGGKPQITYSNNFAVTHMTGMMKSPTNYQMAIMDNEANIHNGAAPMYTADLLQRILNNDPNPIQHPIYGGWKLFFTNTDWEKELLENGFQQRHAVSISGNNANSNYYLSGSYSDQHGVVKYANDNNKLYNLRLNYDYNLTSRLRLESKVSLDNQVRNDIGGVGNWVIGEAIFGMPNHPVYTSDGKFFAQGGWSNAVAFAKEAPTSTYNTRNINTNFKLIADIVEGLKLNVQAGINNLLKNSTDMGKPVPLYKWDGNLAYYSIASPGRSWVEEQNAQINYHNYTSYLQYNKKLGGRHDLDVMVGGSYEKNETKTEVAGRYNIVSDNVWDLNLGIGDMYAKGGADHWAIGSYFSRVGYVFDDKYMLEGNLRYDGSSRFQLADKRWGLFPGISAGWRISKESFFKNISLVNDLKLRASYGTTGNQEGIGLYDFIQKISLGGAYPFGAGRQDPAASLNGMVAYKRTWETLINKNVGLDASLLSRKLSLSFDWFTKRNKDMLISVAYPTFLGATAPTSNAGELKTWGFETSLGWSDKIGKFQYSARVLVSDAQNKLVNLGGSNTYTLGLNGYREGYPINSYFAYVFDGLIRNQAELDAYKKLGGVPSDIGIGDARFKDLNNDGKISLYSDKPGSDGDVKYVGTTSPRYNYGINLSAKYGGLDLAVFLQGVGQRTLFRTGDYSMPWSDWWRQPPAFYYGKTWNEDRPNAEYPRLSHGDIRYWNYQASTLQQINAAYIRLKNLQIGYSLPENLLRSISISRARIYVSGQDIWESSHVKGGWDPESADWGGNYPFQRYYSFGLDLTF